MKKLIPVAASALFLVAACSSSSSSSNAEAPAPTAAVNQFPYAYADATCHFIYACCTPADRANQNAFDIDGYSIPGLEAQDDFQNEANCDVGFAASTSLNFQEYEDSVAENRASYNQSLAQACLTALTAASTACDPDGFAAALAVGGACDKTAFYTGLVADGAACTIDSDCATKTSVCLIPTSSGGAPVVTSVGVCGPPPAVGAACTADCAPGSCCGSSSATCVAYAAEGAACQSANIFAACPEQPSSCDPAKDYCNVPSTSQDGSGVCAALIANGNACDPNNGGTDCASGSCDATSKCAVAVPAKLQICMGNSSGL